MKRDYVKRTTDADDERKLLAYLADFEHGADLVAVDRAMGLADDYMETASFRGAVERLERAGEIELTGRIYHLTDKGRERLRGDR